MKALRFRNTLRLYGTTAKAPNIVVTPTSQKTYAYVEYKKAGEADTAYTKTVPTEIGEYVARVSLDSPSHAATPATATFAITAATIDGSKLTPTATVDTEAGTVTITIKDGDKVVSTQTVKIGEGGSDEQIKVTTEDDKLGTVTVTVEPGTNPSYKFDAFKFTTTYTRSIEAEFTADYTIATMKHFGSDKLVITWLPVDDAEGYEVTFDGQTEDVGKPADTALTVTKSGLTSGKLYTATVLAYIKTGTGKAYTQALPISAYAGGSATKKTNPKKVTAKAIKVKAKKTKKIAATVVGVKKALKVITSPKKLRYVSMNTDVATVGFTNGKVKGKAKGTTYVYAIAANGVYKKIKVKVTK